MISDVLQKLGSWSINISDDTPFEIVSNVQEFGHVAFVPGRNVDVQGLGDQLLTMARYVGIIRLTSGVQLGGISMVGWLGDEDSKGQVYESPLTFTNTSFANSIRALLPDAVREGTLHSVAGSYTDTVQYEDPRTAIDYVVSLFGGNWRVNGNATLDAGLQSDLFVSNPTALIVKKDWGADLHLTAIQGAIDSTQDAKDFTTRVLLMGQGTGTAIAVGSADIVDNPYKDMYGNPLKRTRLVSESTTTPDNTNASAQLQLNRFSSPVRRVTLSTEEFDMAGDFRPGDYVWVFDPQSGLYDPENPIPFRGQTIYPTAIQVIEVDYPIGPGYTVAYRDNDGNWTDLSQYYVAETGSTTVSVGDNYSVPLVGTSEAVQPRLSTDTMPPATPTITNVLTSSYLAGDGQTKARLIVSWATPLNQDGSDITDGAYYTIRYKVLGTTSYNYVNIGWGVNNATIGELSNGTTYDIAIEAVDTSNNHSGYASDVPYVAEKDNIPPSTPAAPTVAGSPLEIQVIHDLGKSTGGTFDLENDLAFIFVYASPTTGFSPSAATYVGRIPCGNGNLSLEIPAIGSFPIVDGSSVFVKVTAVDSSGNESQPSSQASATALLIDTANISDLAVTNAKINSLSATKITAGTIGAYTVTIADGGVIESQGFVSGVVGWAIQGNGDAEFNDVTIRATLESDNYVTGVSGWIIEQSGYSEFNDFVARGTVQSSNYVSGSTGWQVNNSGNAEFNSLTARGTLESDNYSAGSAGWLIRNDGYAEFNDVAIRATIQSSNYVFGSAGWQIQETGYAEFNDVRVRGVLDAMTFVGATYDFTASDGHNGLRIVADSGNAQIQLGDQQLIGSYIGWEDGISRVNFEAGLSNSPAWHFTGDIGMSGILILDPGTIYSIVQDSDAIVQMRFVPSVGYAEIKYPQLPPIVGNNMTFNLGSTQMGYDSSSARNKNSIDDLIDGGDDNPIWNLRSRNFRWNEDVVERSGIGSERVQTGFIAEEVFEVMPSAVHFDAEGLPAAMNDRAVISYLVDAVQHLKRKVDANC